MSSDLTGATSANRGIDQLFRILTAGPAPDELSGEQSALTMFRANVGPRARSAPGTHAVGSSALDAGTSASADGMTMPIPARHSDPGPERPVRRPFPRPARWGVWLAAAGAIAIGGATTAAAYTAALPAPVQNLAHQVLGFAGVPDAHHRHHAGAARSHLHPAVAPGSHSSAQPGSSARASATPSMSPSGSPSPSSAPVTGPAVLSASAGSTDIVAGTAPVIDGHLTRSGTGMAGVQVTLIERLAGHRFWHVAATGQTNSTGNVAITGPSLTQNAVFRLRVAGGVHSASVLVKVTPYVDVVLTRGTSGRDLLAVSTRYARAGDVVWLQVQSASGSWVSLRDKTLNAERKTWFILSATKLENKTVRVVLVATLRHAAAASNTVTIPPPG